MPWPFVDNPTTSLAPLSTALSRLRCPWRLAPQNQRILHRIGVVIVSNPTQLEADPPVELPRGVVGSSHFERGPPAAGQPGGLEDMCKQRTGHALTPIGRPDSQVVDV